MAWKNSSASSSTGSSFRNSVPGRKSFQNPDGPVTVFKVDSAGRKRHERYLTIARIRVTVALQPAGSIRRRHDGVYRITLVPKPYPTAFGTGGSATAEPPSEESNNMRRRR
jgi:hypothetical protein